MCVSVSLYVKHRVEGGVFTVDLLIPRPAPPGTQRPRALVLEYVVGHRWSFNRPQYSGAILLRHHLLHVGAEMKQWEDIIYVDAVAWEARRQNTAEPASVWIDELIKSHGYDVLTFRKPRVQVVKAEDGSGGEEGGGGGEEEGADQDDDKAMVSDRNDHDDPDDHGEKRLMSIQQK